MTKTKRNFRKKLLQVTVIPLILTGIMILIITYFAFSYIMQREVQRGLQSIAVATQRMADRLYIGDYYLKEEDGQSYIKIYKGMNDFSGYVNFLREIKQETGIDITFFYGDVRVITTLANQNGESLLGTQAHSDVVSDVLVEKRDKFYKSVLVGEQFYFAYYAPLYNGNGNCIGMIFAGKPTEEVRREIVISLLPIFLVLVGVVASFCVICNSFTNEIAMVISRIKRFLGEIAKGNLKEQLDERILLRDDELGEMGRFTIQVQKSLCEMVEKDMLTKLYSRRIGDVKLRQVQSEAIQKGTSFTVAMGDIDLFKQFNDSYGHDCGDKVLEEIAAIVADNMEGRGFAVRWGGEEFLIVYEGCSVKDARRYLEKMREDIVSHKLHYNEEILSVTMTFGIVEGIKEQDVTMSIKMADEYLYQGKINGRNRIVGVPLEE